MKFIFEVRMKPGYTVDDYAEAWIRASEIIQRTPGARGTYLHRKIGSSDTLLAIATWDSKAHRDAKDDRRDETGAQSLKSMPAIARSPSSVNSRSRNGRCCLRPPPTSGPGKNEPTGCTGVHLVPSFIRSAKGSGTDPRRGDLLPSNASLQPQKVVRSR